jgi:hypothetical protein
MTNIKLVILLKTFSNTEIIEFRKFVESPYFNTARKYVAAFLLKLLEFHPGYDLAARELFKELYPGKPFNDTTMRKISSEGLKMAEEFLVQRLIRGDKLRNRMMLLRELSNRKADSLFNIRLRELNALISEQEARLSVKPAVKRELSDIMKFHYSFRDRKRSLDFYDAEMNFFAAEFCENSLARYVERLTEKKNFSDIKFALPFFDEMIREVKAGKYAEYPVLNIHFNHVMMLDTGEWQYYHTLKALKDTYFSILSLNERKNMYVGLINFIIEKNELNQMHSLNPKEEIFRFYTEILERGLIEQFFSEFLFLNIVTVSLQLGRPDFAVKFITDFSSMLNPEIRNDTTSFCNANVKYFLGQYGEALSLLGRINFKYYQQKLLVRNLTIKIYFDRGETFALQYQAKAYRTYLKREKNIPAHLIAVMENFLVFTQTLLEYSSGNKPGLNSAKLEREIRNSPVAEKFWLLEKLADIDKKQRK